jgi:predicted Zn-dependent peptidase
MALEKFRKILYPDHPYGRLFPTEAMISSYRMDDIAEFYQKNYGAVRTHLYIVGVFDRDAVIDAVRQYLGDWRNGEPPVKNPPASGSTRAVYLVDRPGAVQSTILIGQPVIDPTDPDYIPMQVTNYLIGGFFSSRVILNIREDKGWAYSPYSSLSSRYHDAYWVQQADVSTEVTGAAIREIFHEIDRLRTEPPPEEELNGIKNYMTGVFVLQNSSRTGIINQLAFADLQGLGEAYLTGYVKNVFAVTPEDITRIVNTRLRDEKFTIVIAGDVSKIKKEVEPFGKIAP